MGLSSGPPRILVVEDVPDIAALLAIILRSDGYEVVCAADGLEALRQAAPEPDLLLLDMLIPPPDGFEVAQALRARYPSLPILAVTVLTHPAQHARASACGVDEVITKPFDPEHLLARVREWLGRRRTPSPGPCHAGSSPGP